MTEDASWIDNPAYYEEIARELDLDLSWVEEDVLKISYGLLDPVEAIRLYMRRYDVKRPAVYHWFSGSKKMRSMVDVTSNVLNKQVRLSLTMIRRIWVETDIPAHVLIRPYKLRHELAKDEMSYLRARERLLNLD